MSAIPTNEFIEDGRLPEEVIAFQPEVGLVLGSGLGSFVDRVEVKGTISYDRISGLPESKVVGHSGQFVLATLGGTRLIIGQGRVHLYEGHPAADVTAGVRAMAAAGISRLVLTNAAGTANPDFAPGSWMAITDHINQTGTTPLLGGAHFVDMSEVYSGTLASTFRASADKLEIPLHAGVYCGNLGPQYETPAEVKMAQALGADAVGMSTVLEAIQARALGLEVAGFSCLTNWGAGMSDQPLHHGEVIEAGQTAASQLVAILEDALPGLRG